METRDVVGFEEFYSVGDDGTVWSKRMNRPMKEQVTKKGYRRIGLYRDGKVSSKFVHRIVCEAFHGPRPFDGAEVDHIDADPANNRPDNLRWVSGKQNYDHSVELGNRAPRRGVVLFNESGDVLRFDSVNSARAAGFPVEDVLKREAYTIRGYAAVYEDEWSSVVISVYFEEMELVKASKRRSGRAKCGASAPKKVVGVSLVDGTELVFDSLVKAKRAGFTNISQCLSKNPPIYKGRIWYVPSDGRRFACSWTDES